jgi:signal transduction histidine kinase
VRRRIGADATLKPITDEMARQLARIQQALQELLTFARPATPTFAPVDASDLIERAIRLVLPAGDRASVTIEVQVDPHLGAFPGDGDMLHHALVNVLMNAVQACAPGGRVVISASAAANDVRVAVADNGRGIAPEHVDAVFKPFFTTRHTGTGLGLSITREIAQRHNGTVTLTSELGVGTVVTIHLPYGAGAAARPAEAIAV